MSITSKTDTAGQTYYYKGDQFVAITAPSAQWPQLVMVTFVFRSDLTQMVTSYVKPEDESRFIEMVINQGRES